MQFTDKKQIATAFGRAAPSYDQWAGLQRDIADSLIHQLLNDIPQGKILDAGCGTGYVSRRLRMHDKYEITALDISQDMLNEAQRNNVADYYVQGDIEHLPLLSNQFDAVISSLAIQWCHSLEQALTELVRVLKPGGHLYLSTLIQPSLWELTQAWQSVDDDQHVLDFLPESAFNHAIEQLQVNQSIESILSSNYAITLNFDDIWSLLRSLQGIGATAFPRSRKGLMGKAQINALSDAYPKKLSEKRFSLTYQVLEILIVK